MDLDECVKQERLHSFLVSSSTLSELISYSLLFEQFVLSATTSHYFREEPISRTSVLCLCWYLKFDGNKSQTLSEVTITTSAKLVGISWLVEDLLLGVSVIVFPFSIFFGEMGCWIYLVFWIKLTYLRMGRDPYWYVYWREENIDHFSWVWIWWWAILVWSILSKIQIRRLKVWRKLLLANMSMLLKLSMSLWLLVMMIN